MTAIFALCAIVAIVPLAIALCAYVAYPAVLWVIARSRGNPDFEPQVLEWPSVTVTVPIYNASASIRETLDHLLDLDYPPDKLQILVISDASDDGTDDIVRSYAQRGVELLRLSQRRGKTVAENAAADIARGDILVNVDSTILVPSASLKKLVRVFENPEIGVASGRDVSKGQAERRGTHAESGYVGYEMWIRDLETQVGSIVGASGCFYASRRSIHARALPPGLSWDFASALNARTQGYRSVSVREATCIVPRATEVRTEMKRKVRTMARGLRTLFYYRELMNPFAYGSFAIMLITHKLLRWLPYLFAPFAYVALCVLAMHSLVSAVILGTISLGLAAGIAGIRWKKPGLPRLIALSGFVVAVFSAGFLAWLTAFRQTQLATWEPTARPQIRVDANQDPREAQLSV